MDNNNLGFDLLNLRMFAENIVRKAENLDGLNLNEEQKKMVKQKLEEGGGAGKIEELKAALKNFDETIKRANNANN